MKQRAMIIIIFIGAIILVTCTVLLLPKRVNMDFVEQGEVVFKYENFNILETLSEQEVSSAINIFDGKKLYIDYPSCGFTEDISIRFNDSETFCFARDTCPIIYSKEQDRYFKISEEEKKQLYSLLEEYGFVFPCV